MLKKIKSIFIAVILTILTAFAVLGFTACGDNEPESAFSSDTFKIESNGASLAGILKVPNNYTGKIPVVICCNGSERTYNSLNLWGIHFPKEGMAAAVQFDYTCSGWGGSRSTGETSDFSLSSMMKDILAIYGYLEQDGRFDMDRISLLGYSLGGLVAADFAYNNPDMVHNLLLFAPAFDMYYYARGYNVAADGTVDTSDPQPRWGDPYADGAEGKDGMSLQYIRECWSLDYSKFFSQEGYTGSVSLMSGTNDYAHTYAQAVMNLYGGADNLTIDLNWKSIDGATHKMPDEIPNDLLEYTDAYLSAKPL